MKAIDEVCLGRNVSWNLERVAVAVPRQLPKKKKLRHLG